MTPKDDRPSLWRRRPAIRFTDGTQPPKGSNLLPIVLLVAGAVVVATVLLLTFYPVTVRG